MPVPENLKDISFNLTRENGRELKIEFQDKDPAGNPMTVIQHQNGDLIRIIYMADQGQTPEDRPYQAICSKNGISEPFTFKSYDKKAFKTALKALLDALDTD